LRLIEDDDTRGIGNDLVRRVRAILTALIATPDFEHFTPRPGWRFHQLQGDRAGTWSLSVSGNWRLTFRLEEGEICNLDLEDYH
jgi:proteic killer suppression protein